MPPKQTADPPIATEDSTPPPPQPTPQLAEPDPPPKSHSVDFFSLEPSASQEEIQKAVERRISDVVTETKDINAYNILVLYDRLGIARSDANRIYSALDHADARRPILLVLTSPGGDIAAAYFIGKLCREHTTAKFEVAVPREAKSAATLVCCGADVIHMGSLSELGPIDPQFDGKPALALKHSLEHLAEIAARHPGAKEMLSDYLAKSLPVDVVGYLERAAGSAVQYAERLLSSRLSAMDTTTNANIARRLVYDYKDHSFAIDAREATSVFGRSMVMKNTPQYNFANRIYRELSLMEFVVDQDFGCDFMFTGGLSGGCRIFRRRGSS